MDYLQNYKLWKEHPLLDPKLKEELAKLSDAQIKEAFSGNLEFGTGGLRGIVGVGTNRLNIHTFSKVVVGYANYLLASNQNVKNDGVVICYDNRCYSEEFSKLACEIFAGFGIKSYRFAALRPTPMLSFAIRHLSASGGLMITASHNPKIYNGVKAYNQTGAQLDLVQSDECISFMDKVTDYFNVKKVNDPKLIFEIGQEMDNAYFKEIKNTALNPKGKKHAHILYSPLHGTGGTIIPQFLTKLGYKVSVVESQREPDANFTNALSTNPEMDKAWEEAVAASKKFNPKPECIILTDPDADRAGVAFLEDDSYVLLNGNQQAALLLEYILSHRQANKTLVPGGNVISTIVTSDIIRDIAVSYNQNFIYCLTGFKHIAKAIDDNGGSDKFSFGCEESIGGIIKPFVRDKDSVQLALIFAEIACEMQNQGLRFSEYYTKNIHEKYGYYLEYTENIVREGSAGKKTIDNVMNFVRTNLLSFSNYKLLQYADFKEGKIFDATGKEIEQINLPRSNVLKFFFDFGWVVFRPSGTEPKLKIYFSVLTDSQEKSGELVNTLLSEVYDKIKDIIGD